MEKDPAAVALGKRGGTVKSEAKTAAARANGAKGGRPISLESIFDSLTWQRKFQSFPDRNATILHVWRNDDAAKAAKYLRGHQEETRELVRSVWLFSDSLGQALSVTQDPIE